MVASTPGGYVEFRQEGADDNAGGRYKILRTHDGKAAQGGWFGKVLKHTHEYRSIDELDDEADDVFTVLE